MLHFLPGERLPIYRTGKRSDTVKFMKTRNSLAVGDTIQITDYDVVTLDGQGGKELHGGPESFANVLDLHDDGVTAWFPETKSASFVDSDNFKKINTLGNA